ncbi:Aminomethyltransferase, mitochondrial [Porphyridium purpureum]|uniref:Aminomethyltransferase n=1 Tax=Porphyridium purpureum TaxID=35688 RepID=A0A5J4YSL1_PORPP|nr:Aminomethyltransferase, mitochondrial [Porphyridium purpureum]|eukprot:POR4409..scf229_5
MRGGQERVARVVRSAMISGLRGRGYAAAAAAGGALKQTVLHDKHMAIGGKMVEFAGYDMPVQYPDGIMESHLWVRANAGLFDVSHMGQVRLHGKDRVAFLEKLVVADVAGMAPHTGGLSVLTNANGGIIDDTIITNLGDVTGMVINAGCKDKDLAHMREHLEAAKKSGMDVDLEVIEDHELLALQGPKAMEVLIKHCTGIDFVHMPFMMASYGTIAGAKCLVTRCGYTGEDGFEISMPAAKTLEIFEMLTADAAVRPVGLGARDSLRMEAGLCLYGNDIDETTTPVEAALTWTIGKRRKEQGGFLGDKVILKQLAEGVSKRRCGFLVEKGAPPRGHETILSEDGQEVGVVTSGGFAPSVGKPIGMGYVNKPHNKSGTKLQVVVRKKANPILISKTPFVPSGYYKVPE